MEFIQSTLFSNIVALLALAAALYSVYYTHSQNKFSFAISDIDIEHFDNYINLNIVVSNDSPKTHILKELAFLDENYNAISLFDIAPEKPVHSSLKIMGLEYLENSHSTSIDFENLEKPEVMLPYTNLEFSYDLTAIPKYIKIVSNKRINKIHKYFLIPTDFY